jgi:hypothetical protein
MTFTEEFARDLAGESRTHRARKERPRTDGGGSQNIKGGYLSPADCALSISKALGGVLLRPCSLPCAPMSNDYRVK